MVGYVVNLRLCADSTPPGAMQARARQAGDLRRGEAGDIVGRA